MSRYRFLTDLGPEQIAAIQTDGLNWTCRHAFAGSPVYRERLAEAGYEPGQELALDDLTLLLTGHGDKLFLPAGTRTDSGVPPEHNLTAEGASYLINNAPLPGILELSDTGAPIAWREQRADGWRIEIEPEDENPLLPRKLRISHPKGYSALILVKEVSRVSPPYTTTQMDLPLPPGTAVKPLEK